MIDRSALLQSISKLARSAADEPTDRWLLFAVLLGYPAWQGVVRSTRALDRLVCRGLLSQPIRAPVFVVGHPRSGTTFFHRLLALDPRFCAPRAWELLLPSVSAHRAVERATRLPLARIGARHIAHRMFSGFAERHATSWLDPEEDDWLLLHAVASPTVELLTGEPAITSRYWIADALPEAHNTKMLQWYRRSVQRILFASAPEATWLSKSPPFTGWIRTLARAFPDARFVMLVREPEQAIASHLEMTTKAWYRGGTGVARSDPRIREVFDASCALYRHAEVAWAELPLQQRLRISYDALVRDPEATMASVWGHFGWIPSAQLLERTAKQAAATRRRIPKPQSRLRWFGIRTAELQQRMNDLDPLRGC